MIDPASQFNINIINEAIKVFGDVPDTFGTLIDLTSINPLYIYTHIIVVNSLDKNVKIKIGGNELTIQALKDIWMDKLSYNGIIEYKYVSDAPIEGSLQIICY
ncbi:unnamed protein product [marine sediment metagenome]|uniref:Uncharacterized protein n=1 Tax=marine sediment metagenome TaxID=412755 RepID=X0UH39_9ZZZZ